MKSVSFVNKLKFLTAVIILALTCSTTGIADMFQTSTEELKTLTENGVAVVDVRTPEEWRATGVIPESHLLTFFDQRGNYNLDEWLSKFSEIVELDDQIVIICAVGNRSQLIGEFLSNKMGYQKVYNATHGIQQWITSGFPVEQWPQ